MSGWQLRLAGVLVPTADRGDFTEEWEANLEGASELGLSTREVEGAALRDAVHRRELHVLAALTLQRGLGLAAVWWAVLCLVLVGAGWSWTMLCVLLAAQGWMVLRYARRRGALCALLTCQLTGLMVGAWLFGLGIEAADDPRPDPWYLSLWWPALLVGLTCLMAFAVLAARESALSRRVE